MDEETTEAETTEAECGRLSHRLSVGGEIVGGVLAIALLVPVIRRFRAHRHERHRRHFPVLGH